MGLRAAPHRSIIFLIGKINKKRLDSALEEVYEEVEDWDGFLAASAEETDAVAIEVYDGYDTAVAVVRPREKAG